MGEAGNAADRAANRASGKAARNAVILIAGHVAAGKTTFSHKLAEALHIPVFNKDNIKAVLGGYLPVDNRAQSKNLSRATFGLMAHIAENLMKTGVPFIWESNFAGDEPETLRFLTDRYAYRSLSFVLVGDLRVIYERFTARENTPMRDPANRAFGDLADYPSFASAVGPLSDFDAGGEMVRIDTTDFTRVDFKPHIAYARQFLQGI